VRTHSLCTYWLYVIYCYHYSKDNGDKGGDREDEEADKENGSPKSSPARRSPEGDSPAKKEPKRHYRSHNRSESSDDGKKKRRLVHRALGLPKTCLVSHNPLRGMLEHCIGDTSKQ